MPIRLGAVILGAGASSRMGRPKLPLPWAGTSIVGHLLALWQSLGAQQIAVVCAPYPHPLHAELDRLAFADSSRIINPAPESGMFSSVQCAARWSEWSPDLSHIAVLLGDQPQIRRETLDALLRHAGDNPHSIGQPAINGRPKHPVIFPTSIFPHLAKIEFTTLRDFLENSGFARSYLETGDESLSTDLDKPSDYADALRRFVP
jgi:molybdenum cofactor cytidylyltransferase